MRLLAFFIAIPALFLGGRAGIAADVYSCEVRAAYSLSDDGMIRQDTAIANSRFMLDKILGRRWEPCSMNLQRAGR